uniref:Uncharacterized protein n=1 Tax=Tanacetum cinerariifolium TaxID=118510 RepID=A0A699KMQ9_TANCI|nr:hypothetical protein [Tanacetum cinerariifolium]
MLSRISFHVLYGSPSVHTRCMFSHKGSRSLGAWVFVGVSSRVVGKGVDSGGMAAGSGRMEVTDWREIWRMNRGLNVGCDREGVWEFYNISPYSL